MLRFATFLLLAVPALGQSTGPWDVKALQTAAVKPEWGETVGKAREVYYPGEPYQGKPTRVFAYYAKPAGDGPFPAIVLVHGGGGKAFREWAEHWSARGYCALAMDLAGNGPKGRRTGAASCTTTASGSRGSTASPPTAATGGSRRSIRRGTCPA